MRQRERECSSLSEAHSHAQKLHSLYKDYSGKKAFVKLNCQLIVFLLVFRCFQALEELNFDLRSWIVKYCSIHF